jgi:hypothetical protein
LQFNGLVTLVTRKPKLKTFSNGSTLILSKNNITAADSSQIQTPQQDVDANIYNIYGYPQSVYSMGSKRWEKIPSNWLREKE